MRPWPHWSHHFRRPCRVIVYENNVERANRFARTYFQNCIKEWNQLDVSTRSSQTISELKRKLIQLVRPKTQSYFGVHDIEGIRYLTQIRVKFSGLQEHIGDDSDVDSEVSRHLI